jgi:acid phosphatase
MWNDISWMVYTFTTSGLDPPTSHCCYQVDQALIPHVYSTPFTFDNDRHGDRTPYNGSQCWPGDKAVWSCNLVHSETPVLTNEDNSQLKVSRLYDKVFMPSGEVMNGDCSVGQLTSIGYKQHLTNGHSLNAAYVKTNFLKPTLDPSEVHLRSDDVPRTLLSAQSLTLGMFPPDESNEIQHVPLYTRDIMYDTIEGNGRLCPKYSSNKIKFYTSDIWNNHNHNVTMPLINEINKAVGFNTAPDREAFEHFQDCLVTHKCHNLSLPNGMTDDLYRRINDEVSWRSYNQNKYPSVQDMSSVGVGFLLKDIWKVCYYQIDLSVIRCVCVIEFE